MHMMNLDELDRKILRELIDTSDMPIKELAKKIDAHPNTVFQRIKRLKSDGVIVKHTTILDYDKIGYNLQALIFVNVKMGKGWEDAVKPLSSIQEIESFILLTGEHDILLIVRVRDKDGLSAVLRKIQNNDIVAKTTSHLILDYYKKSYQFNPFKEK
jgi:DNA-binding Lrp family transcriptional regulator